MPATGSLPDLGDAASLPSGPVGDAVPATASGPSGRTAQATALEQEAALVRVARQRLHAGDIKGAFAQLEVARTWFPKGVLLQEREALMVELLDRSGQHAAAHRRARVFVRAFPRSPFTPSIQRVLDAQQ
jgi:hypothetical protein